MYQVCNFLNLIFFFGFRYVVDIVGHFVFGGTMPVLYKINFGLSLNIELNLVWYRTCLPSFFKNLKIGVLKCEELAPKLDKRFY